MGSDTSPKLSLEANWSLKRKDLIPGKLQIGLGLRHWAARDGAPHSRHTIVGEGRGARCAVQPNSRFQNRKRGKTQTEPESLAHQQVQVQTIPERCTQILLVCTPHPRCRRGAKRLATG